MKPSTEVLLGMAGALILFAGGAAVKNKVEDETLAASDEFLEFDPLFKKYGSLRGVDWTMLKAIAMNESSLGQHPSVRIGILNPSDVEGSKSEDGKSWGLMQITLSTGRDYDVTVSAQKLNRPEYSIDMAAKHVALLQKLYPRVLVRWEEAVIKSYNQGQGNTRKELNGTGGGFANEYWARYQRNRALIKTKQGV